MNKQVSPFASLTGAEKQIRWLEYQSIRLPYVQAELDKKTSDNQVPQVQNELAEKAPQPPLERPVPPPEIPRSINEFQKTRHSQYDAVIARMKQAELQARRNTLQLTQESY